MAKQQKNLYDEYSIVTETPREFTRRVPSTYLGSSSTNTNLVKEVFANAVDEHAIGHGDTIEVVIDEAVNCTATLVSTLEVEPDAYISGNFQNYTKLNSSYYTSSTSSSNSAGR